MTHPAARIVSIILAAGAGRRIGGNKGLLVLGGQSLLERLVHVTRAARVDDTIVVTGCEAAEVEILAHACGARCIRNSGWNRCSANPSSHCEAWAVAKAQFLSGT